MAKFKFDKKVGDLVLPPEGLNLKRALAWVIKHTNKGRVNLANTDYSFGFRDQEFISKDAFRGIPQLYQKVVGIQYQVLDRQPYEKYANVVYTVYLEKATLNSIIYNDNRTVSLPECVTTFAQAIEYLVNNTPKGAIILADAQVLNYSFEYGAFNYKKAFKGLPQLDHPVVRVEYEIVPKLKHQKEDLVEYIVYLESSPMKLTPVNAEAYVCPNPLMPEIDSVELHKSILEEAHGIVEGGRGYEHPTDSLPHIAQIASGITRKNITAKDVTGVLIALKLSRESFAHKRDNLVDACGYLHILQILNDAGIE